MYAGSVLVEQLEENGLLKTVKIIQSLGMGDLVVGFPDDYDEPREGPLHFLDERYEEQFRKGMAECKAVRLGKRSFSENNGIYTFTTWWRSIPVGHPYDSSWSYYALFLPIFGTPIRVSITDPSNQIEIASHVYKDIQKNRFSIFILKAGRRTSFDFDLTCDFRISEREFLAALSPSPRSGHPIGAGSIAKDIYCLNLTQKEIIADFLSSPSFDILSERGETVHPIQRIEAMQQPHVTNIAREHLIRELTKEIPLIGKMVEAMTFGVVDDVKKKEDKEKLYGMLNAASTDLGDILKQLGAQRDLSAQMNEAIRMLIRYIHGPADARAVITVEGAAVQNLQLLPASVGSVASYLSNTPIERYHLNEMLKGMTEIQIDEVIGDIPEARNYVRMEAAKARKVQDLLDWAEADDGPTLNGLYAYVQRRKARMNTRTY